MPNRLKELRKQRGLTQKELSLDIGFPVNTLANYERGDREPKLATWEKLADYYGVSVAYLQGYDESKSFEDMLDERDNFDKSLAIEWTKLAERGLGVKLLNGAISHDNPEIDKIARHYVNWFEKVKNEHPDKFTDNDTEPAHDPDKILNYIWDSYFLSLLGTSQKALLILLINELLK